MKRKLYIRLLEDEVSRLSEKVSDYELEIERLKDAIDPSRAALRNISRNMEREIYGIAALAAEGRENK